MKNILFIILAFSSHLLSFAQPGALDLSFDPGTGIDYEIWATAIQNDGKIIIGGLFSDYNGVSVHDIARIHPDGSLDTTFLTGTGGDFYVFTIAIQSNGKILIGGAFTSYNGISTNRIMRLNEDGSIDTTFHTGTGFDISVQTIVLQSDEKILVGGEFTSYNNVPLNHICRLNTDGSVDTTFNSGTGPNRTVEAIVPLPDGSMMIGGDFLTYNGSIFIRIARINADGSLDSIFASLPGASHAVRDISLLSTGQIIAVGNFYSYDFQPKNGIVRLNSNGTIDVTFATGSGPNYNLIGMQRLDGDNLLVGGWLTSYNGNPVGHIARIHANGALDTTFNYSGIGADDNVHSIALQADGKIIIGGRFTHYNGISRRGIARLYNCTTPQPAALLGNDSTLCPGEVFIYSVPPVAESYEWTLPAGWTGSSDSASIIATSNGQGGMISVRAFSDSCGYSAPQTKNIHRVPVPEDPICLVTVDELSTHNILIWEKTRTNLIDSFFIYRETSTSVYTKIASVPYDSLSEYHDYGANPNTTSYSYKLSSLDTCGVETEKSPFHNTIHLQNLGTGNFQWTFYQIENSPNPITAFNVYRDPFGNGNFFPIGNVPGTNATFTDITYSSFPDAEYVVDANWGISCTPQRGTINTTRSNIRKINVIDIPVDTHHVGMNTLLQEDFEIYPNPAENTIILNCFSLENINRIELFNSLGQMVWSEKPERTNGKAIKIIPVGELPKGVYVLAIETNTGSVKRKVIVQ